MDRLEETVRAPSSILPLALVEVTFAAGGRTIVDAITCEIGPSARTVIVGPNGAGKSVLMRLCHGLLAPTTGRIEWRGAGASAVGRRQAMVFQRPVMLRRSAQANIEYALALHGVPRRDRWALARDALGRVGLGHLAERPARVLSGGEQQRLAIARAWALRPEVLFLDEPTASLDPTATREIEAAIDAIHASGTKIVMTTHNLGQARRLADEILFLHQGRLVERAPAIRFFTSPATAEAAAFIKGELPWT
ncbi:MAG: phosphate ABC transporter ATP-binding protein [Burkholderiales bacterium]|nr:phosphate ABC transporter ATP-binding protein [Burkholderiales bacterium]